MCHVGVVAGERTPVITDRNPHLETLMDARRTVYLPHTEDANMVVDLPNMSGEKIDNGEHSIESQSLQGCSSQHRD